MSTYILTNTSTHKRYTVLDDADLFSWAENESPDYNTWYESTTARKLLDDLLCETPDSILEADEELREEAEWIIDLADEHGWDTRLTRADHLLGEGEYTADDVSKVEAAIAAIEHDRAYSVMEMPTTEWHVYNCGVEGFASIFYHLEDVTAWMRKRGYVLVSSAACDHPDLEEGFYIHQDDVDEYCERHDLDGIDIDNVDDLEELMDDVYGHGYEPRVCPVVVED